MADEPLDASTHEGYLDGISNSLREILKEIKELRKDIQELTREVGGLDRG